MKKILILISVLGLVYACNYGTYADSLKAEKKLISNFITRQQIHVIHDEPQRDQWGEKDYLKVDGYDDFYFHLVNAGDTEGDTVKVNGQIVTAEDGKSPLVYYAEKVALDLSGTEFEKTAGARMKKYEHDPNGQSDATVGKNDIVLFRYADVVLMKAEALVRKGQDAMAEINAVRDRVGATQLTSAPTLDDVYYERWRELMWEGWHRNDMIRFGKWTTNGTLSPTDHTTVFPIPGDMMLMHPQWKQNEGY